MGHGAPPYAGPAGPGQGYMCRVLGYLDKE